MSMSLYLEDDGDETVHVFVNEELLGSITHEEYGWGGMRSVIALIKEIAETFDIRLFDNQNIC